MRTFSYFACLALLAGVVTGCAQTSTTSTAEESVAETELTLKDGGQVLGDAPAATAFGKLKDAFAGKTKHASLAIYELKAPKANTAKDRSARLMEITGRLGSPKLRSQANSANPNVTTVDGDQELSQNDENDTERFVNRSEFHKGEGVAPSKLPNDADLIEKARAHVANKLAARAQGKQLYAYRLAKYYNGSGDKATRQTTEETVYQVAAVFNEMVDDVPVIGPGGKLVVHMKHDGTVVEHEASMRDRAKVVRSLTASDLLTPEQAAAKAEEGLRARGLTIADVVVERSEFGYMRSGRNAHQNYMSPHYAFFYRPLPGKGSKVIVEVVSAVKAPDVVQLLEQDAERERMRKGVKHVLAGSLDDDRK
jgi:hypothetical protein